MRVTNSMMIANMMRNISKNQSRMDKLQQNMATGKKFLNPSDDPIGVSRSLRLNTDVSIMDQYKRNIEDAGSWMTTTELATNNMVTVLQRARELTVQASNGSNTVGERSAIAAEIKELKEQLINIGNTSYAGRYIFSGYKTDQKLLNADGTYDLGGSSLNSNEVIAFNVGIGEKLGVNTVGQRIFGYAVDDADLDKNISTGIVDNILKAGSPFAANTNITAANDNLAFVYNGNNYTVSITQKIYADATEMVTELNDKLQLQNPSLSGHVRATAEGGAIKFISDESFVIPGIVLGDLADTLKFTTNSAFKAANTLEGATVDLTANSFNIATGTNDEFNVSYNGGADVTLTLAAGTYDGTTDTLDDLVADIQSKINSDGTLKGHVTVANVNNRVVFYSDKQLTLKNKNLTPTTISFDITNMGMINNKSSAVLDKKIESGASTQLIGVFDQLIEDLTNDNGNGINAALTRFDIHMGNISAIRAELGVKSNRIELTTNRIEDDNINLNDLLSKNEDADMAEVIMNLKSEENVYNASLSVGARIIQPSLIDFLR